MKKYLFALLALVFSLSGMTQEIFQGSVKKNANPNQVEVVFKPNYNRAAGPPVEYVLFLQLAVSVPLGASTPVSAAAQGAGTFTNMGALGVIPTSDETFGTPSTADDERTYGFVYANPTASTQNWSAGVEFTGVIVTFSGNLTTEAKLLDLENNGGGDNGNTYFILNTNTGGKRADDSNGFPPGEGPLFFAVTGSSTIGFFSHTTQAGPPDRFARTGAATTACNAGTVSGTSPLCEGATATYSSNGDAGGTWSSTDPAVASVNAATGLVTALSAGTTDITYTVSAGCSPTATAFKTLTVNPSPAVSCPPNSSVCINAPAFALTSGTPAGGTYSGNGVSAGQFDPAAAGAGTHTITYTVTAAGCTASCTFTITVNALPIVGCPGNSSVCINAPAFALLGGSPAGGTYSGTGVSGGNFNPATAGLGTHTITYSFTDANGCSNSCSFAITVNPLPLVGCPSNSSVCINAPAFALTGGTPTGGTYSGTGVSGGNFNPLAAGVGAHTITYTVSNANGCTSSCTFTITVNPLPAVGCPSNSSICINVPAFALTGGMPAGGTYSGTGVSGGNFNPQTAGAGTHTITYSFTDGNGCSNSCSFTITVNELPVVTCPANSSTNLNTPAFALTGGQPLGGTYSGTGVSGGNFDPAAAGQGTHTITYTFTNTATGCTNSCTFTITVGPAVAITCPPNTAVCIDAAPFTLTGASPAGGTFSGTGVSGGQFSPAAAGVGAHTITYTTTLGSCTFTITVNPLPTVSCPPNSSVCISTPAFALTGGTPNGGTYSGTGVSGGNFNPLAAGLGTHTITYSFTDGNGCASSCTFTITVNGLPTVSCPANSSTNLNTPPFALTGGLPLGGTYSGTGVSGGQFDPAAAGQGTHTITYTFTSTLTGCTNSCTFTITVGPAVFIVCPANSSVCIDTAPFTLTGASPAGGTFSGPGVSGGQFNPAAASVGTHVITYTTSTGNCTFTITVNPLPFVSCPANSSVCINAAPFALTGGLPAGGSYNGQGVMGGMFDPAAAGVGAHLITYTVTLATGCSASCTFTITVNPLPTVACPPNSSVCINAAPFALTGGLPAGGSYNGPGVVGGIFEPATAGVGAHGITYTYTDGNGCSNSCTFTITVNQLPTVSCPANTSVCISAAAFALTGGTPTGGTYSGTGVSGGNFDPAAAGVGTHTITYTFTSTLTGCTNSCSFTITVNPLPLSGIATSVSPTICDGESLDLHAITDHYIQVLVPQNITMQVSSAVFGPAISTTPFSGDFVYIPDGSASTLGCNPYAPGSLAGKVALIDRGTCLFTLKVKNAQNAGAVGVIIINNVASPLLLTMGGTDPTITIPAVMVSQANGNILKNLVLLGTVNGMSMSPNTYLWSNGLTTQNITVTQSGNYSVTVTNPFGCSSTSLPVTVTVLPVVNAGTISGPANLCVGLNATFTSDGTTGGTWSSSDPFVATVNSATGQVVAVGAGTTDITYSFTNACGVLSSFKTLTVGYNIVATSGGNGTVTPAGTTWVDCNGRVTYAITPDPCYMISDVLIDGVSDPAAIMSGTYTFNNVSTNHIIHVTFVLAGPFNIVATSGGNGTVTPPGIATVACGGSLTYVISPDPGFVRATVLINGVNNPAAVASGAYTFTNVQMDQTIHATFVTACSPTTVTISESSPNDFCANLTLKANPATPGAYTYEWRRGAFVVGTSQTLALTTASPDGVYTVTAASGPGCISAPATYTYAKQNKLHTYTILALDKKAELGEANTVLRGSVGNTKVGGEVQIKKGTSIASPGAFAKASVINVENPANVPIRIYAPVVVTLPTMQYNTTITAGLNNVTLPKTAMPFTLVGNYKDILVKKGAIVTLTGSIFGKILIEEGAKVTFTNSVVNIYEMEVFKGTSSLPTTVLFSNNCNVRSKKKVKIGEYCRINTTSPKNVVFYVAGENFEVKGKYTNIVASVYAPTKEIKVDGDGPCNMTGRFIAKTIHGHAKNVIWNNYDCAAPPPSSQISSSESEMELITGMEMRAYPNPSNNFFNLKLNTDAKEDVLVRVISVSGKVMQEMKGSPNQVFRVGDGLLPGFYIAEMRQGNEKVTVKLVKQ